LGGHRGAGAGPRPPLPRAAGTAREAAGAGEHGLIVTQVLLRSRAGCDSLPGPVPPHAFEGQYLPMPSAFRSCRARSFSLLAPALLVLGCGGDSGAGPDGPPVAQISEPATGVTYRAGTSVAYAGGGIDAAGTPVPASRVSWWADFHHDTHTHPFLAPITGPG